LAAENTRSGFSAEAGAAGIAAKGSFSEYKTKSRNFKKFLLLNIVQELCNMLKIN